MTIDELRSAAAVVRDATEEGENTATRIGQLFLDTVNTLCNVSTNAIKGYVVISSTNDLPTLVLRTFFRVSSYTSCSSTGIVRQEFML